MILFLICAGLTLLVTALLLFPFFRPLQAQAEKEEYNIAIYRDQLAELARDVKRGAVLEEEEQAARTEIERRMVNEVREQEKQAASLNRASPVIFMAMAGLIPVLAGGLYFANGKPDMPAHPFAERTDQATAPVGADGMHADMNSLLTGLEKKLEEDPDNLENWAKYARSLSNLGRYEEALNAYIEGLRLGGGSDKQFAAEYAETLVIANDGIVGDVSASVFEKFIEEDPNDPQAVYYLALAKAQQGRPEEALADWQRLLDNSPPGAPWISTVEDMMQRVRDGAETTQPAAPATNGGGANGGGVRNPTAAQAEAVQSMSAEDQDAFMAQQIENLAERLRTEEPDNLVGWRMLARSYSVQGQTAKANEAYREVLRLAPNDPDALSALGQ